MQHTFLTTDELAERIKYSPHHIRRHMIDNVLIEGIHYTRPFNGRKILFLWEAIEAELFPASKGIPLAAGGVLNG